MVRVKICGIRCVADAQAAVRAGADAIGVLVGQEHPSSDFVRVEEAVRILRSVPPLVTPVLVTHLTSSRDVVELLCWTRAPVVQIHGDMAPEAFARVRESAPWVKILKAYHVNGPGCLDDGERFVDRVDAFVLDTFNPATGQVGGTGVTHDWEISRRIAERYRCPIILSGGLSAENVAAAIEAVHPFGVDANTGTKGEDGFKDPEKMRAFVRATQ